MTTVTIHNDIQVARQLLGQTQEQFDKLQFKVSKFKYHFQAGKLVGRWLFVGTTEQLLNWHNTCMKRLTSNFSSFSAGLCLYMQLSVKNIRQTHGLPRLGQQDSHYFKYVYIVFDSTPVNMENSTPGTEIIICPFQVRVMAYQISTQIKSPYLLAFFKPL